MAWFAVTRDFRTYQVVQATTAQGNSGTIGGASVAAGPFTTRAQAQAWVSSHAPAGSPPPPAGGVIVRHVVKSRNGQWWVINTSPPPGTQTVYTVVEGTESQATSLPNAGGISGPYSSLAAANAVAAKEPLNAPIGIGPGHIVKIGPSGQTGLQPPAGLAAIGSFFQRISTPQMLLRIAEVLVGGILLIVGLARMAGVDQKLGGVLKLATKVAP